MINLIVLGLFDYPWVKFHYYSVVATNSTKEDQEQDKSTGMANHQPEEI